MVVRQLVRQLVYTMFISNNRASFHLWWKKNLVIHQKVLKYYENDCILVSLRYSVSISYVRQSSQLTQFLWTQFFLSLTVQNVGNSFLEQRPYLLLKFQMKNYHRHPRICQWLSSNWDIFCYCWDQCQSQSVNL